MADFKKILIAVDGSPIAAHAAEVGTELGRALGAELAFFHAVDPSEGLAPEGGVAPADLIALAEVEGKKLVEHFRQRAVHAGLIALTFTAVGQPAHEIVRAAKDWSASLIVVGSHGRGGIKRVVLGSVAAGVMKHAPCPVLTVRAP